MATPIINIFVNTANNTLLTSLSNPASINPQSLAFFYPDTPTINIYFLQPLVTTVPTNFPFSILPPTGANIALYLSNGVPGGTVYAAQTVWTADPTNTFATGSLALNTANIQAAVASGQSLKCVLAIGFNNITQYADFTLVGVGLPAGGIVPVPGLTPLSKEVADQTYVKITGNPPGQPIILVSPLGKKIILQAADNADGTASFQASPLN